MNDLPLEQMMEQTHNLYATVTVVARRARQVTDQQKMVIDSERTVVPVPENKESEDFDEVEIDREALLREHTKLPKPTRVAIEEMMSKKISWEFTSPESEA